MTMVVWTAAVALSCALVAPPQAVGCGRRAVDARAVPWADVDPLARKTRIVLPEVRRAFYRSGGKYLIGKKVYLRVEASVLRREARRVGRAGGGRYLIFENRTVPLVIRERGPYWRQVSRHLDGASWFSVRGRLRVPKHDPRGRVHLYVESVKRTPGHWK